MPYLPPTIVPAGGILPIQSERLFRSTRTKWINCSGVSERVHYFNNQTDHTFELPQPVVMYPGYQPTLMRMAFDGRPLDVTDVRLNIRTNAGWLNTSGFENVQATIQTDGNKWRHDLWMNDFPTTGGVNLNNAGTDSKWWLGANAHFLLELSLCRGNGSKAPFFWRLYSENTAHCWTVYGHGVAKVDTYHIEAIGVNLDKASPGATCKMEVW